MQVNWVFEKDAYQDGNTDRMIAHCKRQGISYQLVDYVVFGSDDHIRWKFGPDECVVVYGAIGMAKHVQRTKAWSPGVWCDWHQFKCSTYLSHWGQFSVQRDYMFLPIAEVYRRWDELWAQFSCDGYVFIKPDDNDKRFHGERVSGERREAWYRHATFYEAPVESLALVSRPSRIASEWRFVIADRKAVTGSLYRADGRQGIGRVDRSSAADRGAIEFAERVAGSAAWQPAPIYTLDVCMLEGGDFRLMEAGSVNCCGLYDADVGRIIDVAGEIALAQWHQARGGS